jgi:hypothetical protein
VNHAVAFRAVGFYIPRFPVDLIHPFIVVTGNFFEGYALDGLANWVLFGSVAFDIGTNIGSQALHWQSKDQHRKSTHLSPSRRHSKP